MARRRFYAPPSSFAPDHKTVVLTADEARHARDVLRLQAGDEVYVFDGAGKEFRCTVHDFNRDGASLNVIQEVEPARPESPLDLTLAIALLKGEKFDLVAQKATELGVHHVIPIVTERADVRIRTDEDAKRKVLRWQRIALEAAKQCGRARLMTIETPKAFAELMKLPKQEDELRLMLAERNGNSLLSALDGVVERPRSVTALIGPEGGWTDDEIDQTRAAGWKIVTLGGRTLRAETAAIVIAALLQHRFGDLS